jgi:hypothetical protein
MSQFRATSWHAPCTTTNATESRNKSRTNAINRECITKTEEALASILTFISNCNLCTVVCVNSRYPSKHLDKIKFIYLNSLDTKSQAVNSELRPVLLMRKGEIGDRHLEYATGTAGQAYTRQAVSAPLRTPTVC